MVPGMDALREAIEQLDQVEVARLSDAALADELRALHTLAHQLQAQITRRLRVFDARGAGHHDGAPSTTSWLRGLLNLSPAAAADHVRTARTVTHLPEMTADYRAGRISLAHLNVISRLAEKTDLATVTAVEPALAQVARHHDPSRLALVAARVREAADPAGAQAELNEVTARRRLHLSPTFGGAWALDAILDDEGGTLLRSALEAMLPPPAPGDDRSPAQRRADALVDLASTQLRHHQHADTGGERPHLNVTIDATSLLTLTPATTTPTAPPAHPARFVDHVDTRTQATQAVRAAGMALAGRAARDGHGGPMNAESPAEAANVLLLPTPAGGMPSIRPAAVEHASTRHDPTLDPDDSSPARHGSPSRPTRATRRPEREPSHGGPSSVVARGDDPGIHRSLAPPGSLPRPTVNTVNTVGPSNGVPHPDRTLSAATGRAGPRGHPNRDPAAARAHLGVPDDDAGSRPCRRRGGLVSSIRDQPTAAARDLDGRRDVRTNGSTCDRTPSNVTVRDTPSPNSATGSPIESTVESTANAMASAEANAVAEQRHDDDRPVGSMAECAATTASLRVDRRLLAAWGAVNGVGGRGQFEWGGHVHAETARRIACDAAISRILLDPAGQPLDVGRRTRVIPPALRRALAHRDQGCRFTGCGRPAPWTDAHHIQHWINGGPTSLDNLILICRHHHRLLHEEGWTMTLGTDRTITLVRPDGTILEPP